MPFRWNSAHKNIDTASGVIDDVQTVINKIILHLFQNYFPSPFVSNRRCLLMLAPIRRGDGPGCSKQQPHTYDNAGLSLPRQPHCCHMEGTFARHHFMPLSHPLQAQGEGGRWKRTEGEREANPERMLDKDGSRDILSTFISSGGGEPCWILARC